MVARVGSIEVLFSVSYDRYEKGMRRAAGLTEREGARMSKSVGRTDRSVKQLSRSMAGLRTREFRVLSLAALRTKNSVDRLKGSMVALSALGGGFAAAFTIKGISDYSDTYKEIGNRLRVVKKEAVSLASVEEKIFEVAQKSRNQYEATGVLYARLANSARRLKLEQKDILRVTETIQKSFLVGGSTPMEAAQSSIQLSQGIASNRLQGDELRSVLENPALGQLLADKITDGDLGKLREIAAEGKLTADVLIAAFKDASAEIDALFAKTQETIGQAFVKLDNAILRYIGTSGKMNASASATVVAINAIAENIDTVADSLIVLAGAFASIIGGRALGGFVSGLNDSAKAAVFVRKETVALAKAELGLANKSVIASRSKMLQQRLALNRAINQGKLSAKQMDVIQRKTSASIVAHRTATQTATIAQTQFNAAVQATSVRSMATAVSVRALSGAMSFLGGPIGVALLALGGAFFLMQKKTQAAEERAERYADSIKRVGLESLSTADRVKVMAGEIENSGNMMTMTSMRLDVKQAQDDIAAFDQAMRDVITSTVNWNFALATGGIGVAQMTKPLTDLYNQLLRGDITTKQFKKSLDDFGAKTPGIDKQIKAMQEFAVSIEAAGRDLAALTLKLDDFASIEAYATVGVKSDLSTFGGLSEVRQKQFKANLEKNAKDFVAEHEKSIKKQFKAGKLSPLLQRIYGDVIDGVDVNKSQKKKVDRLAKALAGLDYKVESLNFSKLDQDTVQFAKSAGIAETKIRAFIDAVQSGGQVPAVMEGIRSKLAELASSQFDKKLEKLSESNVVMFLSDLDRETVKTARSFGVAEDRVKAFIQAAASGDFENIDENIIKIRQEMEKIAENKKLITFADDVANVFGDVANALFEGGNVEDIFTSALKSIAKLIFQLLIVKPLMESISNGLTSSFSGGGGGSSNLFGTIASAAIGALKVHDGNVTGKPSKITAPASMFNNAPRLHNGLKSGEYAAVLENTESVLTANDTNRTMSALQSASQALASGNRGQGVHVTLGWDKGANGNIEPIITNVAQRESASASKAVARAVPGMVDSRNNERQVRRIRPRG